MKRILFVSRTDGTDVRIRKEVHSLLNEGASVSVFVCNSDKKHPLGFTKNRLNIINIRTKFGSMPSSKLLSLLFIFLKVFSMSLSGKYTSLHAVDEEMMIPCLIARTFRKVVVLDLFDSVELKFSNSSYIVKRIMLLVSVLAKNLATCIIVTDPLRHKLLSATHQEKAVVVPNYPALYALTSSDVIDEPIEDGESSLFLGGTLYESRGLDTIIKALGIDPNIHVHCAGWVYDDVAENFIKHKQVTYHGVLSQEEAYSVCRQCLVNVALYKPNNLNNIYASPNKVYDSLCMGQYVFLNSETKLSKWISKSPLVKVFSYDDAQSLVDSFQLCRKGSFNRTGRWYRKIFTWEQYESRLVAAHAAD